MIELREVSMPETTCGDRIAERFDNEPVPYRSTTGVQHLLGTRLFSAWGGTVRFLPCVTCGDAYGTNSDEQ